MDKKALLSAILLTTFNFACAVDDGLGDESLDAKFPEGIPADPPGLFPFRPAIGGLIPDRTRFPVPVPIPPAAPSCIATPTEIGYARPIQDIAVSGNYVFAADYHVLADKGSLIRVPRNGGATEVMADVNAQQIATDGGYVFMLSTDYKGNGEVSIISTAGGARRVLTSTSSRVLAVEGFEVWLIEKDYLRRFNVVDFTDTVFRLEGIGSDFLAVDKRSVYVTTKVDGGPFLIHRLDKATNELDAVAKIPVTGGAISGMTITDSVLYVTVSYAPGDKSTLLRMMAPAGGVEVLETVPFFPADIQGARGALWIGARGDTRVDLWRRGFSNLSPVAELPGNIHNLTTDADCLYFSVDDGSTSYLYNLAY